MMSNSEAGRDLVLPSGAVPVRLLFFVDSMITLHDGLVFWYELFVTNWAFLTDGLLLHPVKTFSQFGYTKMFLALCVSDVAAARASPRLSRASTRHVIRRSR